MILITFSYKDIRYTLKNIYYLYITSFILGGILYYLNIEFSYKQKGVVFYHRGLSINVLVLFIISPLILYTYIKEIKHSKNHYNNYYKIKIFLEENFFIEVTAFLDTGNHLKDPYFNKPVILINKKLIPKKYIKNEILIPYTTIDNSNLLKCIRLKALEIDGYINKNILMGLIDKINIDGVDCIINQKILEGKND